MVKLIEMDEHVTLRAQMQDEGSRSRLSSSTSSTFHPRALTNSC